MKKLLFCMCLVLLQGCGFTASQPVDIRMEKGHYEIEQGARLQIALPYPAYAAALQDLWDRTYPSHKGALTFYKQNSLANCDVAWMRDIDIAYEQTPVYSLSGLKAALAYPWPSSFEQDVWKDRFFPVSGSGLIFVYNKETAKEQGLHDKDFRDFTYLQGNDKVYYHNRTLEYMAPFFFAKEDAQDEAVSMDQVIASSRFQERLHRYRSFYKDLGLSDDTLEETPFYEDGRYVSGLIRNDGAYRTSTAYTSMHLHFSKMPSYQGYALRPILDIYGFAANADTHYPNAVFAFLQLVRSQEGMKAMLAHSDLLPLMQSEDVEQLGIYDVYTKQILIAMNASQPRSSSYIREKPSITLMELYEKSNLLSQLQNSMYTKEKDSHVQEVLDRDIRHWILIQ